MLDQFIGLILIGLGIKNQVGPQVKGDSTEVSQEVKSVEQDKVEVKDTIRPANTKQLRRDILERSIVASREARTVIDELKTKIKDEQEQHKAEIEAKHTEFKQKIQEIKDERKKTILERLQTNFKEINDRRITQLTKQLESLQKILDKMTARVAAATEAGKDTTTVSAMLSTCQTYIGSAKDAIAVQSGNTYTIAISSEATVKNDVGATRQALQIDLNKVNTAMKNVHTCMRDALKNLALLSGEKTESTSGEVTPTVVPTL